MPADLDSYLLFFLGFLAVPIAAPAAPAASPAGIPPQLKHTLRMSAHPLPKQNIRWRAYSAFSTLNASVFILCSV